MNKQYEQLIARYLAGENVDALLIAACQADENLRQQLAQDVAFARIVHFALIGQSEQDFMQSLSDKLKQQTIIKAPAKNTEKTSLWSKTKKLLSSFNNHWQPLTATFASVIFILVSFNFFVDKQIGVISKVIDAATPQGQLIASAQINKGEFSLAYGYAEVLLSNGVTLLLEAPVALNFHTPDYVVLNQGNLVAKVPQNAIGFKIDTPSSEIVDLGTEFGVSVDNKGQSQVHVLTGEIKVRASKNDQYENLTENQARAFDLSKQVAVIKSQPQMFMRALPGKSLLDPDYLHWSFDHIVQQQYPCNGKGIDGQCFNAQLMSLNKQITAPANVTGKFANAVYFNGLDNWLETEFSGIGGNDPRTVTFWLKVPKEFSVHNAFGILSWGLSEKLSAWQISPNPAAELGTLGGIRIGTNHAEVIGTTELTDESWHHIAIVLYGGEAVDLSTHVLIYVDGKLEKTSRKSIAKVHTELAHPNSKPLRMGVNIAFNNPKNQHTNKDNRFFKGWLDELYIFNTALSHAQIKKLMISNQFSNEKND